MHIYFLKESLVELTKSISFFQTDFFQQNSQNYRIIIDMRLYLTDLSFLKKYV